PDEQLKVHHGKMSQDAALKLLAKRGVEDSEAPHDPPVVKPKGEETHSKGEPQPEPGTSEGEPQAGDEPPQKDEAPAGKDFELRTALESFIDRLSNFDLDSFSPQNPGELLRLVHQAQKKLTAIKRKASKGKASSVRLVLVG